VNQARRTAIAAAGAPAAHARLGSIRANCPAQAVGWDEGTLCDRIGVVRGDNWVRRLISTWPHDSLRFSNWFRITWWLALQLAIGAFLWARWPDLVSGRAAAADVIAFVVLVALALAPIYEDVGIFGFRLRQQLRKLEQDVSGLRADVRNAVEVRNQFAPSISLGPVFPPEQLAALAAEVRRRAEAQGVTRVPATQHLPDSDQVVSLFRIRYDIEREVRRVAASKLSADEFDSRLPVTRLAQMLHEHELIDRQASIALTELYTITSRAIHGEEIPPSQIKFTLDVYSWLLAELRAMR
jgi:hypothetical protein